MLPRRPYVTTRAHEVVERALDLAVELGHDDVTPVHVAIGIVREGHSVAAQLLNEAVPLDVLERELAAQLPPPRSARVQPREHEWTPMAKQILAQASDDSLGLEVEFFGCEHLLLALLREETIAPAQVLARHGVHFEQVRERILQVYAGRPA
jgi:ATP-dependent Clp protease ATP-binding subunit ClpC